MHKTGTKNHSLTISAGLTAPDAYHPFRSYRLRQITPPSILLSALLIAFLSGLASASR